MRIQWGPGPVGDSVAASYENRLTQFIQNEESETIQLFAEEFKQRSITGDWYGEHAGKWLVAVSHAYRRTGSEPLAENVRQVVRFLIETQESNGYLGTYASEAKARLSHPEAADVRTWDTWIHAWMILGLLKAAEIPGVEGAMEAAKKIGDLLLEAFPEDRSILDLGNHQGLSSSIVIEPLCQLTLATGNPAYAELANEILDQMEERGLALLSGPSKGLDISEVGTGKVYQLCWTLVGLVSLYRTTGNSDVLEAAEYWFENISQYHLTPFGGPWGGVATHKEVFNPRGFFDPSGLTETCSMASWMSLCRELFLATGKGRYLDHFERTLCNGLIGAMDQSGKDWCYFSFPNGRRNNTYHWACCKSSGAMALEETALVACTTASRGFSVNLWESFESDRLIQQVEKGRYWKASISVKGSSTSEFEIAVRIPFWGSVQEIAVNDVPLPASVCSDGFWRLSRAWEEGDKLEISLDVSHAIHAYVDQLDHHGQEIVRTDFAFLSWGPYVYATELIDGYKKFETLRLPRLNPEAPFQVSEALSPSGLPVFDLVQPGRPAIPLLPYFEAGGRHDAGWRALWMQVAWQ